MIAFKDSAPQQIREQEVAVTNVETIVVPDLYRKEARTEGDGLSGVSAGWSQFVRVWYRAE